MARVTVEDCILNVPNRFELVLLAARRAREMGAGAALTVARDNDKNPVVALREISENSIDIPSLRDNLIRSMQRHVFVENHEDELDEEFDEDGEAIADNDDFEVDDFDGDDLSDEDIVEDTDDSDEDSIEENVTEEESDTD